MSEENEIVNCHEKENIKFSQVATDESQLNSNCEVPNPLAILPPDSDEVSNSNSIDSKDETAFNYLQNEWSLWFCKRDSSRDWTESLHLIEHFNTVEDFWRLIDHITPPFALPTGCDYYLFRRDIKPMWEHNTNRCGGSWQVTFKNSTRSLLLNRFWENLTMLLVGEGCGSDSEIVCGGVVNVRKMTDRLCLWVSNYEDKQQIMRIGRHIKRILEIDFPIEFYPHIDVVKNALYSGRGRPLLEL